MQTKENLIKKDNDFVFVDIYFMSNETHFYLSGYVNKPNWRYWAPENPCQLHVRPLHCHTVTVWRSVSIKGVIGPYICEDKTGIQRQ